MIDSFVKDVISTLSTIGAGLFFVCSVGILVVVGVGVGVLKSKNVWGVKKRRVFLFVVWSTLLFIDVGIFLIDSAFSWMQKTMLLLFFLAIYIFFNLFNLPEENSDVVVTDNHKKLIEKTDEIIYSPKREEESPISQEDDKTNEEINFSHVLSVLEKLKHYNLNKEERAQMNELKFMCADKEVHAQPERFRTDINEKLSALLKIMSKYNV